MSEGFCPQVPVCETIRNVTQEQKQKEFFELAECFRRSSDPVEIERLGNDLGRMVFGDYQQT